MKPEHLVIAAFVALFMFGSGVVGWYVKDYQSCKFDLAAYNKPILGTDD